MAEYGRKICFCRSHYSPFSSLRTDWSLGQSVISSLAFLSVSKVTQKCQIFTTLRAISDKLSKKTTKVKPKIFILVQPMTLVMISFKREGHVPKPYEIKRK
jgi:hypothetical protein